MVLEQVRGPGRDGRQEFGHAAVLCPGEACMSPLRHRLSTQAAAGEGRKQRAVEATQTPLADSPQLLAACCVEAAVQVLPRREMSFKGS